MKLVIMNQLITIIFFTAYFILSATGAKRNPLEQIAGKIIIPKENGPYISEDEFFIAGLAGGKNSTVGKHKHIAALYHEKDFVGSAIIIGSKWLVTAAWNIYWSTPTKNTVRVGSSYAYKDGDVYQVDNYTVYPDYDDEWKFDIAVVKLTKDIKFSKNVQPIKLASKLPKKGAKVIVSGWGWDFTSLPGTQVLKEATVNFVDYKTCKPHYQDDGGFTSYSFCTSNPGVGPCAKDFGSPLVYQKTLIGVYSGAYECAGTKYPPVYADVTKYKKWIESTIKKGSGEYNSVVEEEEKLEENEDDENVNEVL